MSESLPPPREHAGDAEPDGANERGSQGQQPTEELGSGKTPTAPAPSAIVGPEDEPGEDEEQADRRPTVDAPPRRRRIAVGLLVGGLLLAFGVGRDSLPTARAVVIRLEGERAEVRTVALIVGPAADGDEVSTSVQWRYDVSSTAPPAIRTEVKLANGDHRFRVEITQATGARTETTRVLRVSNEEVTIRARTR